ncbi:MULTISPECIES: phage head closure protein [Bacillaceae]|uniref:phage head closure protein n=1 Tax=Bacillaceae TaxID=186817 RepID=UPI000BFCAB06|nr:MULTISPECIES: phage head closure protein [Bacillaceae]PGT89211.1 hypothetical protein COD11_04220 [Bacillus sp. AFS040349]UGB31704.1 phage head closure protein [Metabacillus sp. B2-18]
MNPGLLDKRLSFSFGSIWAKRIVKSKRSENEQNEEEYEFIIRKNNEIDSYLTFTSDGVKYLVLTVDNYEKEKGYMVLKCEKAKIHTFYDTCTIKRYVESESVSGETISNFLPVYTNVACELVRLETATTNETEQQTDMNHRYELYVENETDIKIGDKLEVAHKGDLYNVEVRDYFKSHTHQVVTIELEGEA